MNSSYTKAIEVKAQWLRWTQTRAYSETPPNAQDAIPAYEMALECNDIYFMNKKFCDLVDHARQTIPDDLGFDLAWVLSRKGFLWLEEPFSCPNFLLNDDIVKKALAHHAELKHSGINASERERLILDAAKQKIDIKIRAIGWVPCGKIVELPDGKRRGEFGEGKGTSFLCFHEFGLGYGMWSYFTIGEREKVIDRIRSFEANAIKEGGAYAKDRISDMLHEIRWVYTAFHLMSQKLAVCVHTPIDRACKRRAKHENRLVPDAIKVVSLRRLEEARKQNESEPHPVDWQWQWLVGGHWRNQYYAAANEHRPVFIESYVKGPV